MFSWSASRKGTTSTRLSTTYPGTAAARPTPPIAQTIHGTIRPPEYSRQEHLNSYVRDPTLSRSTRKVSTDDSTYDTVFQTTTGEALILRIYFPITAVRPQMTLVGIRATHPWLDARMKLIGYAALQSDAAWTSSRMLLGQAVHEVVEHLQLNPPAILEMTDPGLKKLQASLGLNSSSNNANQHQQSSISNQNALTTTPQPPDYDTLMNTLPTPPPIDMPYIPQQYPDLLDSKSREELQELLDDFLKFEDLLRTLPVVQELAVQRQSVDVENHKMATELLERQEEYETLHHQVTTLQQSLGAKLEQFEKHRVIQDQLLQTGKANVYQLKRELNKARKEAFESSEEYAEAWVNGRPSTSSTTTAITEMEFCKQFVAKRNIMHIRAAKLERLEQEHEQFP